MYVPYSDVSGPLVGLSIHGDDEIRLPDSCFGGHAVVLGQSGVGKSTLLKRILVHRLDQRAKRGSESGGVVVLDAHGDLARDALRLVPPELLSAVCLLDFGSERVPSLNLLDPVLFPDREWCVGGLVGTFNHLWDHWGNRLEDVLRRCLSILYEYNRSPETSRAGGMLTLLDLARFLEGREVPGEGTGAGKWMNPFQEHVLSRVTDRILLQWFDAFLGWNPESRLLVLDPICARLEGYASHSRTSAVLGQRESDLDFSEVVSKGLVLLVSTGRGVLGSAASALVGGAMLRLVESSVRGEVEFPPFCRSGCFLVCDDLEAMVGVDWDEVLSCAHQLGVSVVLSARSLTLSGLSHRKVEPGILGRSGVVVAYRMGSEDAELVAAGMDSELVDGRYLEGLDPRRCVVRVNTGGSCYPVFEMKTLGCPSMS